MVLAILPATARAIDGCARGSPLTGCASQPPSSSSASAARFITDASLAARSAAPDVDALAVLVKGERAPADASLAEGCSLTSSW